MPHRVLRMVMCVALAASVGAIGTVARATQWSSNFDPTSVVGYDTFNLSANCTSGDNTGFFYVNGWSGSPKTTLTGCSVQLLSATATLNNGSASDTIQYSDPYLLLFPAAVWGIDLNDGALTGVDSFPIGPVYTGQTGFRGFWWIQFADGTSENPPTGFGFGFDGPLMNTVSLCEQPEPYPYPQNCSNVGNPYVGSVVGDFYEGPAKTVPEPGSLGLLLGALGAGWWVRRRKVAA